LALYKKDNPSRNKMVWKWLLGAETQVGELGNPTVATGYRLCMYDGSGRLIMNLFAPAGGLCGTRSCWKATSTGYIYRNGGGAPNGLINLTLRSGPTGKAKITATAKGLDLALPTLPPSQFPGPAQIQLINSTTFACWTASYNAPARESLAPTTTWSDNND
jgi:hypothetical protein